jgi:hypothetical protein
MLAGAVAGAIVFLVLVGAGWLFYTRLYSGSLAALLVILVIAAVFGGYAGWLLGVIVFSALRGPDDAENQAP